MKKIILTALLICLTFTACDSDSGIKPQDSLTTKNEESQNLEKLYNELVVLSAKDTGCSGDLDFIAIGKKPCGGPEKYIPYSLKINTTDFLAKVNFYNSKQNEFNEKWHITSTCDVVTPPIAAVCIDGKATLIYENDRSTEKQNLEKLFNEIIALSSNNSSCSGDWDFTAIGSKPCGGPEKYIPYSVKINIADFFAKVNNYNSKQIEFNEKWKINSTCDIVPVPIAAVCINGKGTLLYESDRNIEKQDLEKLYNEIITLSGSNKPCTGNWNFTAIGLKSCGSAEKYIPYSLEINTSDFFTKVNLYNAEQMEFNEKWKISSTCNVTLKPQSVDCVDGKATLIY